MKSFELIKGQTDFSNCFKKVLFSKHLHTFVIHCKKKYN